MTRTMPPTDRIRIWIWGHDGSPVRVTLQRDVELQFGRGGATDEGYAHESSIYLWDGRIVWADHESRGRDCDGGYSDRCILWWAPGLETHGAILDSYYHADACEWIEVRDDSVQIPEWRRGKVYRGLYHTGDYDFG